ncbi:MAG: tRNA pseudouridine(38-40) synthase TruA [Chloroflexi bacterium]|nr:tRNA pseudouridine(38-40) synthase TruA [Chloroflexota bacterium]MCL5074944.1 tRNA pseudouridine(38-40) synthase TruA [Chloroflexota bacterium]
MLVVEYDGSGYCGFQLQRGLPTIQGELEQALSQITGERIRVIGAGRTDAGVHAAGQVVNFKTASKLEPEVFIRALKSLIPRDIVVKEAKQVPTNFHARHSARNREYRYVILNRPFPSALVRHLVYHYRHPLNVEAMCKACQLLVGTHDFASFSKGTNAVNTVRQVQRADCKKDGDKIYIDLEANAFLPHMVRNIVGTLLWVGGGKLDIAGFENILLARDRTLAGPTAPAHGLCLIRVNY